MNFNIDYIRESMMLEDTSYSEQINRDGLPENIEIRDGVKFKSKYNFKNKHPYKMIKAPFMSYDDAEEFCRNQGISINNIITESYDIYVQYKEVYKLKLIGYIIDCIINQYEGNTINNTFNEFPLILKDIEVNSTHNKAIIKAVKDSVGIKFFPTNAGVSKKDVKIKYYIFQLIFDKYE